MPNASSRSQLTMKRLGEKKKTLEGHIRPPRLDNLQKKTERNVGDEGVVEMGMRERAHH